MRVVVVTGACSGMGRACIDAVQGIGDVVVAVDLRDPGIEGTVGIACDVSDPAQVQAVADLVQGLGTFRALVHAAGISPTMGEARAILDINLLGTQYLLDAFEPLAVEGSAAVCFASSAAHIVAPYITPEQDAFLKAPLAEGFLDEAVAMVGGDSGFAYSLSKAGVIRISRVASDRWRSKGARVNSLSPGNIDTPMGRQEFANQPMMRQQMETPFVRFGRADELAAVAAFLVSDAASFVSGIDILADGGMAASGIFDPPR